VPIVLGGKSQPLDVGRLARVVPDGLRRAVVARWDVKLVDGLPEFYPPTWVDPERRPRRRPPPHPAAA
jgi:hypothetical protein